jgi:hypothetical protein
MAISYRQGDVFILKLTDDIPSDAEFVQEGGEIVLAHGEVTGHHHKIVSSKTKMFAPPKPTADQLVAAANQILRAPQERSAQATQTRAYLEVPEPTEIVHEEHAAIPLPAGVYKVVIQREYKPSDDSREFDLLRRASNNWRFVED